MTSFDKFLREQQHDNTATGDIARDYVRDCEDLGIKSMSTGKVRARMLELGACYAAEDAFEQAVADWKTLRDAERDE